MQAESERRQWYLPHETQLNQASGRDGGWEEIAWGVERPIRRDVVVQRLSFADGMAGRKPYAFSESAERHKAA